MDKKIIFFDIDGTLLHEQKHIVPSSTIKAITQAHQNGHLCFVNTGRPYSTIDQIITDLPFDGYICGCGTQVIYHGESIFHTSLEENIRKEVINDIFAYSIDGVLEGKDGVYFREDGFNEEVAAFKKRYEDANFNIGYYHQGENVPFDKCALWYHDGSDIVTLKQHLKKHFDVIQRADDFIEVVPLGCSKATGIQKILDYLDMSIDQTISIGDSTNDLPMLEYTKEAVAMGNSHQDVLKIATYISSDIDHDGIQQALKHFNII